MVPEQILCGRDIFLFCVPVPAHCPSLFNDVFEVSDGWMAGWVPARGSRSSGCPVQEVLQGSSAGEGWGGAVSDEAARRPKWSGKSFYLCRD